MTRTEFNKSIERCMTDIDSGVVSGVCGVLLYSIGLHARLVFIEIFESTWDEDRYWNDYSSAFWLGNGYPDSLSHVEKLDSKTTRLIALGLFEQLMLDSKEYMEWE